MKTIQDIVAAADEKADAAANAYFNKYGDHSTCGYAVIVIPAGKYRKLAQEILDAFPDRASKYTGPAEIWMHFGPKQYQSLNINETGVRAALTEFHAAGYPDVRVKTWID